LSIVYDEWMLKYLMPYLQTTKVLLRSKRRTRDIALLSITLVISSFTEIVSLGSLLPLVMIALDPSEGSLSGFLPGGLGLVPQEGQLYVISGVFATAAIASGVLKAFTYWYNMHLSVVIGHDFAVEAYKAILYKDLTWHKSSNHNSLLSLLTFDLNRVIVGYVQPSLNLVTSAVLSCSVIVTLLVLSPAVSIITALSIALFYYFTIRLVKRRLFRIGAQLSDKNSLLNNLIIGSLETIDTIILKSRFSRCIAEYSETDISVRKMSAQSGLMAALPRIAIEPVMMILIVIVIVGHESLGISDIIPILSVLALAVQKLLPQAQKIYESIGMIANNIVSVQLIASQINELSSRRTDEYREYPVQRISEKLDFNSLELVKATYSYPGDKAVLSFSYRFLKGERICIQGSSGSGKTTLLNLMLTLLKPTSGLILLNGVDVVSDADLKWSWRQAISYVSQKISFPDASLLFCITGAYNQDQATINRVKRILEICCIGHLPDSLSDGLLGRIGLNGSLLSGGERQRVAIARALYENPSVLILDETTSGIDIQTEKKILSNLADQGLDLLIVISHKVSSNSLFSTIINVGKKPSDEGHR